MRAIGKNKGGNRNRESSRGRQFDSIKVLAGKRWKYQIEYFKEYFLKELFTKVWAK